MDITVVIPTIPPRTEMLARALASVEAQTLRPAAVVVEVDEHREGAPVVRDRGLARVETEYVAFLDDDDALLPHHLDRLAWCLRVTEADLAYPWYTVVGGTDPHAQWEGVPWDDEKLHQVPVTFLAHTKTIRSVGGFSYAWDPSQGADPGVDAYGNRAGEDFRLILRLVAAGAKIAHLPDRTWLWYHHGANSMGLPSRW